MDNTFTIQEAREILQVDEDFKEETIKMYLDIADGQIEEQTGYDFRTFPNADSKAYVRMSILMQHYGANGYNKDYDFTFGMHAAITRLCLKAKRLK